MPGRWSDLSQELSKWLVERNWRKHHYELHTGVTMATKAKEAYGLDAPSASRRRVPQSDVTLRHYYLLPVMTELMPTKGPSEMVLIGGDPCKSHTKQAPLASYLGLVRL